MALVGLCLIIASSVTYLFYWRQAAIWPALEFFFRDHKPTTVEPPPSHKEKHEEKDGLETPEDMNGHVQDSLPAGLGNKDRATDSQSPPTSSVPNAPATLREASASQLMPPPPKPVIKSAPNMSQQRSSLQPPARGPLPNRGPVTAPGSASTLLSPLTSSTQPPAKSRKVILAPGHSPLDWAALSRSHPNLAGVPFPQRITRSQLAQQTGRKGKPAWAAWQGKVYNIGPYLPFHPGGAGELMRAAGKMPEVAEKLFAEVHPWVNWEGMLSECLVGFLVSNAEPAESPLEAAD